MHDDKNRQKGARRRTVRTQINETRDAENADRVLCNRDTHMFRGRTGGGSEREGEGKYTRMRVKSLDNDNEPSGNFAASKRQVVGWSPSLSSCTLCEGRERRLVIDVQSRGAGVAVGTTAPAAATSSTTRPIDPVAPVATTATTATALRTFKASVDLEEDLLLLFGARLGGRLRLCI